MANNYQNRALTRLLPMLILVVVVIFDARDGFSPSFNLNHPSIPDFLSVIDTRRDPDGLAGRERIYGIHPGQHTTFAALVYSA